MGQHYIGKFSLCVLFVLSVFVPHLSFFWCLGNALFHVCGIYWVLFDIVLIFLNSFEHVGIQSAYIFFFFFFFFFFFLGGGGGGGGGGGFTALSRIFHLYRADRSSKVGENRRTRGKIT